MTWDFKRRIYCSTRGVPFTHLGDLNDASVQAYLQQYLDTLGRFPSLGADDEYATYFEAAFADEADRRQYIDECIRSAAPSVGHLSLAAQLRANHARIVWTTNFDRLIEDAAILAFRTTTRLSVSTIQTSDVARDALIDERWPLLIKLHGDFQSRRLKNTGTELAQQDELLEVTLLDTCRRFGLAVVGCSGRDGSIMSAFERAIEAGRTFPKGLFWFHHGSTEPVPRVLQLLDRARQAGVQASLIAIESFDRLLTQVALQLGDLPADARVQPSEQGGPPGLPLPSPSTAPVGPLPQPVDPGSGLRAVPTAQGSPPAPVASALASFASTALVNQVSVLTAEITGAASAELERFQAGWREGRRTEARAWLDGLTGSPAMLAAMSPAVAARVLRFAAGVALDEQEDPVQVNAWLAEARRLDPERDDGRVRAVLLARSGDRDAALALLADARTPNSQNLRAALLLDAGRLDEAENLLDTVEATDGRDAAEAWRLRALLRFGHRDLAGAATAMVEARRHAPRVIGVRFLSAVLQYFEGLIPAALPATVPPWPQPTDPALIRREAAALNAFEASAEAFAALLDLDLSASERRHVETWRLAALANVTSLRPLATAFAAQTLARDPSHPYVLLWAAYLGSELDLDASFDALEGELGRALDLEHAGVFIGACLAVGRAALAADRLDEWRPQFAEASALPSWAFWRAQAALAVEDLDLARSLLPEVPEGPARALRAALLTDEARRTGETAALVAHLEASAAATGNPRYLLDACEKQASAGHWLYVRQHVDALLESLPTPGVRRLAIYARYNTGDFAGCAVLLDAALAHPEEGDDLIELRRLRANVREHLGQIAGALDDMNDIVTRGGTEPRTGDLMALARLQFLSGLSHEVAASARRLRGRVDLTATDALMLAEALAHDDVPLARELWNLADSRRVPDDSVPMAVGLGFQLGLDKHLGVLLGRMAALAAAGHQGVQRFTIEEIISLHHEWLDQRHRILEQYRRGETATHVVAQVLNLPLVHLYHVMLAANENHPVLRQQFALQLRDGGRGLPESSAAVAAPGRLAMDISALLLAAHLDLLPVIEQQFAPVRLPHHIMAGLYEQRDRLKPHQPSQLEVNRQLLQAERRGWVRRWDGELPTLDEQERSAAGNWSRWLAILERAQREQAFVLDLPLQPESPHGRPAAIAGPERLARLVTPATLRELLRDAGAAVPSADVHYDGDEAQSGAELTSSASQVPVGSVLYLTDAGAEALASGGLLVAAAQHYTLRIDPDDQDSRRAHLDALPDLEDQVTWVEALIRRLSDGLADGRYELLPTRMDGGDSEDTEAGEEPTPHATTTQRSDSEDGQARQGDPSPEGDAEAMTGAEEVERDASRSGGGSSKPLRRLSMPLRFLADLLALPPGTVDAIWIEDRWLNRHRLAGTARVTDVLEVLAALEATGRLSSDDRWAKYLQLRAANVRILPLSANEILHHLLQAPLSDGRVTETRALRVIRQSAAALVEDAGALRVPPPDVIASGDVGELDVARSYVRAVHDAVVEVWRSAGDLKDDTTHSRVEAQSRWITDNLYLDMGLLRARVVHPESPPEPGVSATGAAGLVAALIQLLATGEAAKLGADDARASAYAQWVYDELIAQRATRDPEFRLAMLERLGSYLTDWPARHSKNRAARAVARLLAGRAYDALPEPLRRELATNAKLMSYIGRGIVTSVSFGDWDVAVTEFAAAGAAAARGESAQVRVLGSEPARSLGVSFAPPDAFELRSPDGKHTILAHDPAFRVLAADELERRAGLEGFRRIADVNAERWQGEVERLVTLNDPGIRLTTLLQYRHDSVRERYGLMTERWRAHGRLSMDDLGASLPEAVLAHLRFAADLTVLDAWAAAWGSAANTLIGEEGPEEAFRRLAGLPLPLPSGVMDYLKRLGVDERRALVRRLLRVPTSPFGLVQAIRALATLGVEEPVYRRLAQRLARRVASPEWRSEVELLRAAALGAYEELEVRNAVATPWARLIAAWYHAHRFVSGMLAAGGDLPRLVEALNARSHPIAGSMFDAALAGDRDVAHPRHLVPMRLALAGLQYASAGTLLFDGPGTLLEQIVERLSPQTSSGRFPRGELLRDAGSLTNTLMTWLPPTSAPDGAVLLGSVMVVPEALSPTVLRVQALGALHADPFDPTPWLTLEVVDGPSALTGADAQSFDAAIAKVDVSELLQRLAPHARIVAGRLARQAVAAGFQERRMRLREAFHATMAKEREGTTSDQGVSLTEATEPNATGRDHLSETQLGALEALYLLSQGESTRLEAMSTFARDLTALGRTDVVFLRRARVALEQFVGGLPLAEAHAFTSLLAEARGS